MKYIFQVIACTVLSLLLTSCAEDHLQPNISLDEFKKDTQAEHQQQQYKQQIWDYAIPVTDDGDYRLQTGDLLTIEVFGIEDLKATVRINSRGNVSLPLLNQVNLNGLTPAEAETAIEDLLKRDYMHDPHVTLIVLEMVGQQVTMVGALNTPGTFEIKSKKTILDILALAGGLAPNASDVAYMTRKANDGKETKVYMVDLHQLISKGKIDMNVPVKGGDVIFIPEAGVVSVDGAVRKPGSVFLNGEMTIEEAIAEVGGLTSYADIEDIKLIRILDDGKRNVVQLSMQDIQNHRGTELFLQEDDIVYVEASGSKLFSTGFGFNLGFMGTGVSYDSPLERNNH